MLLYLVSSGQVGHYRLEEVAAYAGVAIRGRHTARGDALATGEVFVKLAVSLAGTDEPVGELINRQYELGQF